MINRKIREGIVISDKMDKSIIVLEEKSFLHPIYKKRVKRSKKYVAHDEKRSSKIGDVVKIRETKPLSKTKRWELIEVVKKGEIS